MDILSYVIGKSAGEAAEHVDIEQLNVTENNTYTASSKHAYNPVVVNVPQTTIEALNVTSDGTYTAPEGKAYSPISVSVAEFDLPALLEGTLTSIESGCTKLKDYCFYNMNSLTSASFPSVTYIGSYALNNCIKLDSLYFNPESVITYLGTYCFSQAGRSRTSPSSNRWTFDFRKSTFTNFSQYSFAQMTYVTIHFPRTLTGISNYGFYNANNIDMYFSSETPPIIANSNWRMGLTNDRAFIPYNYYHAYNNATNWSTVYTKIGYAYAGTFEEGDSLPAYDSEGYALTWYSDSARTNIITECPSGSPEIYCSVGSRIRAIINVTTDNNTSISITDSEGDIYTSFPAYVPTGRTLTITPSYPNSWTNVTKVDGIVVTTPYTTSAISSDILIISASCAESIDADFVNSSWENVKTVVNNGMAKYIWNVGDSRSVTLSDGTTHNVRIANLEGATYNYSDDSGNTSFIMEFEDCISPGSKMNTNGSNIGGWNASEMCTQIMPSIFTKLPSDLQSVISEVKVKATNGGSTSATVVETNNKLFLPAIREVSKNPPSGVSYFQSEWYALTLWQYYDLHSTDADRKKYLDSSYTHWWLRSTFYNSGQSFLMILNSGQISSQYANQPYGVSPAFCI